MNSFYFFIIYIKLIKFCYSIIPNWKIEKCGISLLNNLNDNYYYKYVVDRKMNDILVKIRIEISKNGKEGKNWIFIKDDTIDMGGQTEWEDIDSIYKFSGKYFICPKGKNYLNVYSDRRFEIIKPENISIEMQDWELKCNYHSSNKKLFFTFLNGDKNNLIYYIDINYFEKNYQININTLEFEKCDKIFDYIWLEKDSQYYELIGIFSFNSTLYLRKIKFNIIDDGSSMKYYMNNIYEIAITNTFNYNKSYSYFDNYTNIFYLMKFNNVKDFKSGYSTNKIPNEENEISELGLENNEDSPFNFVNEVEIKKIKFIRNTKFAYYELIDKKNNSIIYHGIINIVTNKIVFNTNEKLTQFKPISKNSMLIIIGNLAYEICDMQRGQYQCKSNCGYGQSVWLDADDGNYCLDRLNCNAKYILLPNKICSYYCNENIFHIEGKYCGLCKDLYENETYTLLDNKTCIKEKPINTFFINQDMKIIQFCDSFCKNCINFEECNICEKKYILNDKKCIQKCNSNCEDCEKYSYDNSNQNCTLCSDNKILQIDKGNCVEKCGDKYFQKGNICLNCHKNCKTCSKMNVINENGIENENCLSCDENSSFPYLINSENFHKNCVSECPKGTKLNKINNYCEEILKEKFNTSLLILVCILFVIIIIITIFIIKRYCGRKKETFASETLKEIFEFKSIIKEKD